MAALLPYTTLKSSRALCHLQDRLDQPEMHRNDFWNDKNDDLRLRQISYYCEKKRIENRNIFSILVQPPTFNNRKKTTDQHIKRRRRGSTGK